MSVLFNSVSQFIEAVGRRIVQEKPNSLDTIDCIFTGPNAQALVFLPKPKTPHPQYPLMYCARAEITSKEALVAEVRASYVGKLVGAPSGVYASTPAISLTSHLGTISYSTSEPTNVGAYHTLTYTVRYTSYGVSFKYLTNIPGTGARFKVQAVPYLKITNLLSFQSAPIVYNIGSAARPAAGWGGYVVNTLVWLNNLVSIEVNDLDNGWYEMTESYETQPYINSSIPVVIPTGPITIGIPADLPEQL